MPSPSLSQMCFDAERVQGRTSEFGFAGMNMPEVLRIAPGVKDQNCQPYIKARHFLRDKFSDRLGSRWMDRVSKGFW